MLVALQQQHANLLDGQREARRLLQDLADRPIPDLSQFKPPSPPQPAADEAARRGVEDLLHRILSALGVPAPPPPPSDTSADDDIGQVLLNRRLKQIKRSPIVEPIPIRPSSQIDMSDWGSYGATEEEAPVPPPTVDVPPVTIIDVPRRRTRARSASPGSTLERLEAETDEDVFSPIGRPIFEQGLRDRIQRPPTPRRDWGYDEEEEPSRSSEQAPPPPSDTLRRSDDPAYDFLDLLRKHRKGRRGGDGTFIPEPPATVSVVLWGYLQTFIVSCCRSQLGGLLRLPQTFTLRSALRLRRDYGTNLTSHFPPDLLHLHL